MPELSEDEIEELVRKYRPTRDWENKKEVIDNTSEAVWELAESLVENEEMGTDEMSLLYNLCQHTDVIGVERRKEKIDELNIPDEDKERIKERVVERMGTVGAGTYTLPVDGYEEEALSLLQTLVELDNKNEIDSAIREFASYDINDVQSGTMSAIFFFLHPTKYPVINGPTRDGMESIFGEEISSRLSDYLNEAEKYQEKRDKYGFNDNYRDLEWFLYSMDPSDINGDPDTDYYWVNQKRKEEIENGFLRASADDTVHHHNLSILEEGDTVFHYHPDERRITGHSTVSGEARVEEKDGEEYYFVDVDFHEFDEKPDKSQVKGYLMRDEVRLDKYYPLDKNGDVNEGYLFRLSEDAGKWILENWVVDWEDHLDVPLHDIDIDSSGLYFPENKEDEILSQVTQALRNGDNVLFVGPPGTGKSKLAKAVCESIQDVEYEFVTANSDWSTFDTVGGYHPEKDRNLQFKPGVFLSRFKGEEGNPQNEWLIIDEINRADIDKAFGSLFSVLAGDDVTLSFTDDNDESIRIACNGNPEQGVRDNVYYVPDDWRMLATMNTLDKTSLYEMSYAFMRRWAFVSVPVPDIEDHENPANLVEKYVEIWKDDGNEDRYDEIAELWGIINEHRKIGPAIVEDIYEHVEKNPDYASAISMYVIPQLEGLREGEISGFVDNLEDADMDIDVDRVRSFIEDYFQIDLDR